MNKHSDKNWSVLVRQWAIIACLMAAALGGSELLHVLSAKAQITYSWDYSGSGWYGVFECSPEDRVDECATMSCGAGSVGASCMSRRCLGHGDSRGGGGGLGGIVEYSTYTCTQHGTCTPDASCAATTCSDSTCTDSCGNIYAGTRDCTPPPPTCADLGYNSGTYPDCYNVCMNGSPGPYPSCPLCVSNQGDSCNVNACGVPGGTIQCDGSCSGGTPAVVDACPADAGLQCSGPCAGGGGGAVSASLSASPLTISPGGSSLLTWSSSNATSCSGINFSTGGATSGSVSVSPAATTGYTATCTNGSGNASDTETVTVSGGGGCADTGPIDASSTPDRITPGDSVTLTWFGSNTAALSCTMTNLNTSSILKTTPVTSCGFNDSTGSGPLSAQTTFRLTCGSLTKDVTVNVVPRFEEF